MLKTCENMKLFQEKMNESVMEVTMPGPETGRMIDMKALWRVAPSTMADSSISMGMVSK